MDRKNVLKYAGVLLIAMVMVFSTVMVTGNAVAATSDIIFSQGFESGLMPPSGWSMIGDWKIDYEAHSGGFAAGHSSGAGPSVLTSLLISLADYSECSLSLWHRQQGNVYLKVLLSEDNGVNWILLAMWDEDYVNYTNATFDLSTYDGKSIRLAFEARGFDVSLSMNTIFIDDILVTGEFGGYYFMGISVAPLGDAKLEIGNDMRIYNLDNDNNDGFVARFPPPPPDVFYAYSPAFKNPFVTAGAKMKIVGVGIVDGEPNQLIDSMTLEKEAQGVTINISDVISSPTLIVCPRGDGSGFAFYKEVDDVSKMGYFSGLTQGVIINLPDAVSSPTIYMNEGSSAVKYQVMIGVEFSTPVQWTWEEQEVDQLSITDLMVIGEIEATGETRITSHSFIFSGLEEVTLLEHYAIELDPVVEPTITGENNGETGTPYTYTLANTGINDVYFCIDWGDGSVLEWTKLTHPATTIPATHTWSEDGTYTIKAKAMSTRGGMSNWETLEVTMPYSYNPILQFFEMLFQRFPNAFPLLRQLMGY
jgi:hypothetical protein